MNLHNNIRAYIVNCTYNSANNITDTNLQYLFSDIVNTLNNLTNLYYKRIEISNIKNISKQCIEIELVGIKYKNKSKLTSAENDDLIYDLNNRFLAIQNFTFTTINIVNDVFIDNPTSTWPGNSWKEEL